MDVSACHGERGRVHLARPSLTARGANKLGCGGGGDHVHTYIVKT